MSADWAQHAPRPGHACVCGWSGTPGAIEQLVDAEWRAHIGVDAMPAETPHATDPAQARTDDLVVTAETVAAVTKLYVNTALDNLEQQLIATVKAKVGEVRKGFERELSGPEPFAQLLKAVAEREPEGEFSDTFVCDNDGRWVTDDVR